MSSDERVDIVDEDDRVIGQRTRREMRAGRLRHRVVYILVFNSDSQLLVHRRSASKDIYPGCYNVAFGGVVTAGEDYDSAAQRELFEETGIAEARLRRVLNLRFDDQHSHVNGVVYTVTHDGPLQFQASEVEEGRWMNLDEVVELTSSQPFCPDGIEALHLYLDRLDQARRAR